MFRVFCGFRRPVAPVGSVGAVCAVGYCASGFGVTLVPCGRWRWPVGHCVQWGTGVRGRWPIRPSRRDVASQAGVFRNVPIVVPVMFRNNRNVSGCCDLGFRGRVPTVPVVPEFDGVSLL